MDKKIDVMIVGAQKAGTTSLLRYLSEHPQCIGHSQKEFAYFTDDEEYNNGISFAFRKYFSNKRVNEKKIVIAKNAGLYTNHKGLTRLNENNPNCNIIILLRNPVERAYSSFLMEKNYGSVEFDFSDLPNLIREHQKDDESWGFDFFIDYGLYAKHLLNVYNYFPKEQVSVILYKDFKNETLKECQKIFKKIGVKYNFSPNVAHKHNVTLKARSELYARLVHRFLNNKNPIKKAIKKFLTSRHAHKYGDFLRNVNKTKEKHILIDENVKMYLINFYKPHNDILEKLIDRDLSDWSK